MDQPHFKARVRGVAIDGDELLTVRLKHDPSYVCLPGGGLDYGEGLRPALEREFLEELGIKAVVGNLLYVYSWINDEKKTHNLEYFFQVLNAKEYRNLNGLDPTHKHELADVVWVKSSDGTIIRPHFLRDLIDQKALVSDTVRIVGP